jgi:hypothetical protein
MSEYEVHHHICKTVADNKNTTLNKGWAGKKNFVFNPRNIYSFQNMMIEVTEIIATSSDFVKHSTIS